MGVLYARGLTEMWRSSLEVQGQISSDDADVMQVLHGLKLTLLQALEDVDSLRTKHKCIIIMITIIITGQRFETVSEI